MLLTGAPPPEPPPRLQHREQTGSAFIEIKLVTASQTHHQDTRSSTMVSRPAYTESSDTGSNHEKYSSTHRKHCLCKRCLRFYSFNLMCHCDDTCSSSSHVSDPLVKCIMSDIRTSCLSGAYCQHLYWSHKGQGYPCEALYGHRRVRHLHAVLWCVISLLEDLGVWACVRMCEHSCR